MVLPDAPAQSLVDVVFRYRSRAHHFLVHTGVGGAYIFARRYDRSFEEARPAADIHLDFGFGHQHLGLQPFTAVRFEEAEAALRVAARLPGEDRALDFAILYAR